MHSNIGNPGLVSRLGLLKLWQYFVKLMKLCLLYRDIALHQDLMVWTVERVDLSASNLKESHVKEKMTEEESK